MNIFQLELFPEQVEAIDLTNPKIQCLFSSLYSFSGAKERWNTRREKGLTDRELEAAIADEFGIWGGATHPFSHTHKGGKHPKFWLGDDWIDEKPTYQGRELIDLVRKLLDIPFLTHNRPRN